MADDTNQTTLEDGVQPEGTGITDVVEYSETAAALAKLEFRMKGVLVEVTTKEGMLFAKGMRSELRTLRTTLDKKRLQLNGDDQARIDRRNDEAKRITKRIKDLEDPIAADIDKELQRIDDEKIARAQREQERVNTLRQRIETIRGFASRAIGKDVAYIREKIELVEKIDTSTFEELTPAAVEARADTLTTLNELLKAGEVAERNAAALAESQRQLAAQQEANDKLEREAQAQREAQAEADRQRKEAADAEERQRQELARAASAFREKVTGIVMAAIGQTAGELEAALFNLGKLAAEGQEAADLVADAKKKIEAMHAAAISAERAAREQRQREADRLAEETRQREAAESERRAKEKREQDEREAVAQRERDELAAQQRRAREEAEARAALLEAQVQAIPDIVDLLKAINADGTLAKSKKPPTVELARRVANMLAKIDPLPGGQYWAPDGTLMNADGTRSVFDDVDK